ncbi:unnamed protein product, partial [Iphiclides podalirius]
MHDTIRNQLDQDGYVVLEDFLLPTECDELVAVATDFTKEVADTNPKPIFSTVDADQLQLKDKYFVDSSDKISFFFEAEAVDANGDLKVDPSVSLNKVGHALHFLHPIFRCYTYSERVKRVCKELGLVKPSVVQSMYIYKNPGIGSEVIPHQDSTYLHTEPIVPIGFWIALQDACLSNGCLWIARGSHKSGVHRRLVRNPDTESKQALIYDRPAPHYPQSSFTAVPVRKGTCIILHGNVVHKSAHNKSENSRHAYTFHVIEKQGNVYSPDNWLQEGPEAPFLDLYTTPNVI